MMRAAPVRSAWLRLAAAMLVLAGSPAGGQRTSVAAAPATRVHGLVYDSIAMRPLAGAVVQLALVPARNRIASVRTAITDSLGRFGFGDVSSGTYLLGFQHVAVDSLGLRSPVQRLDVRTTAALRADMAVPSMRSLIRSVCRGDGIRDSLAVLMGSVRHARTDAALPGAFVSVRWGEVVLARDGRMERSTPIVDTFANEEGWYAACVPGGVPVTVRATSGNDLSGSVELGTSAQAFVRRDIYVGPAEAELRGPDSTGNAPPREARIVERGTGEARGIVRSLDGRPIGGARVALVNGVGETRSSERGEFVLPGLPYGTHTLEARAIGFVPGQVIVDIVEFRREPAEFVLIDVSAYLLDTVRVAAARRLDVKAREGFERRRRSGTGIFLDESVLDTIRAMTFKDLVRRIPAIRFVRGTRLDDHWNEHIEFMSGRSEPCIPVVYLDGTQLVNDKVDLDVIVHPSVVRRIEVYMRGIAVPAEFASNDRCGVIAIWTGPRRPG